ESVIDAAVISDVRTPISGPEGIDATDKGPVTGRPQQSRLRRLNPGAGNPVIIVIIPGPIARGPINAGRGNRRLVVLRQRRRRLVGLNGVTAQRRAAFGRACTGLSEGLASNGRRRRGQDNTYHRSW